MKKENREIKFFRQINLYVKITEFSVTQILREIKVD